MSVLKDEKNEDLIPLLRSKPEKLYPIYGTQKTNVHGITQIVIKIAFQIPQRVFKG